jgi:hypothetical protein
MSLEKTIAMDETKEESLKANKCRVEFHFFNGLTVLIGPEFREHSCLEKLACL